MAPGVRHRSERRDQESLQVPLWRCQQATSQRPHRRQTARRLRKTTTTSKALVAEGARRASSVHRTKPEAVAAAKELARTRAPSQVLVYKQDGLTVQEEKTYR